MPVRRSTDTMPVISEVLTRRPGWPLTPEVPAARSPAGSHGRADAHRRSGADPDVRGLPRRADARQPAVPVWPTTDPEPCLLRQSPPEEDSGPPPRVDDAVHATGLRKFDLGNVPASVTPPRSWRRAAWFTVGTSAAVVLGLTVAAVELMGKPISDDTFLDALPAYPSGPLTLDRLPDHRTTTEPTTEPTATHTTGATTAPATTHRNSTPSTPGVEPTGQRQHQPGRPSTDEVTGLLSGGDGTAPPTASGTTSTTPRNPTRRTVGPAPVMPTDPRAMGDRTVRYFQLVTSDPAAAHAMTAGSLADEGTAGSEARYAGVRQVEVQDITIDRYQAITISTVRLVREDGTETVERRRLIFTWGGDPKITADTVTP